MKLIARIAAGTLPLAIALCAHAKLPPPSPEEVAAAEQKKAQEQAQLKKAQEELSRAQDQIVEKYRRTGAAGASAPGASQATGETPKEQLPRAVRDLPREAGPHGRDEPGAEAHSAPAGTPQGAEAVKQR
jgi:hypothetical protein